MNQTVRHHNLTSRFPFLMAHVPGGIHYDRDNTTLTQRAHEFVMIVKSYIEHCNNHGVTMTMGVQEEGAYDVDKMPAFLAVSTYLRRVRRSWKRIMNTHGWDCSDALWRRPEDGRDHDTWGDEWKLFRAEVCKLTNQEIPA